MTNLENLYHEISKWVVDVAETNNAIVRALVGVKESGQKFIILLDRLSLDSKDKTNFIQVVLHEEDCCMYGYTTLMGSYDKETNTTEQELHIAVASTTDYVFGNGLLVNENESDNKVKIGDIDTYTGSVSNWTPTTFFLQPLMLSSAEIKPYQDMWVSIRDKVQWVDIA